MEPEEEVALLLKTALPIDDIDEVFGGPGLNFAVIWVDISDRPDLQVLSEQGTLASGYSICTWFYANPGQRNMRAGLRIEMRQPMHFVLPLVFEVKKYSKQLLTLSQDGNFWVVPGPPPAHLVGVNTFTSGQFIQQVVAYSGQGLFLTLEEHMREELRKQLAIWRTAFP